MDGFFIEDDRQTTLCGTVTKRSLSIKKLLIGTIFLFKIRKNTSMCDRTVVQPEYPAKSIQGRPMTEPKPEREALEAMLLGELKHHIDLLQSTEPSFGHATALSRYGQRFLPRREKPEWLQIGPSRACFGNATPYALVRDDVLYAEGYAIEPEPPIPVQHAWLVNAAGEVIDPTWDGIKDRVYFGIAFKRSFVDETLARNQNEPGILVNMHLLRRHFHAPAALEEAITLGQANITAR
jgi:hypothetical protein